MSNQANTQLKFIAKWTPEIVVAEQIGDEYFYNVKKEFIPVQEVFPPYGINDEFTIEEKQKILHASSGSDLMPSFAGHNLDMSKLVLSPRAIGYRIFSGNGGVKVQAGDALLIVVPQPI